MKQFLGFAHICLKGFLPSKCNQCVIAEHMEGTIKQNPAAEIDISIRCATPRSEKREGYEQCGTSFVNAHQIGNTTKQAGRELRQRDEEGKKE